MKLKITISHNPDGFYEVKGEAALWVCNRNFHYPVGPPDAGKRSKREALVKAEAYGDGVIAGLDGARQILSASYHIDHNPDNED